MPLDITITPLHRVGGREQPSLPGLMAAVPPRQAARGRDQDRLIVFLQLTGKAVLSSGDVVQTASRAAIAFYSTPGTITAALRSAAEAINQQLHDRNRTSSGDGKLAVGVLALLAAREAQVTLLLSGPMQAFVLGTDGARHIVDSLSGKGLGLGTKAPHYFARVDFRPGDRLLLTSAVPPAWESVLRDVRPSSLEATRRRLVIATSDELSAVLLQASEGEGAIHLQRVTAAEREPEVPADTARQVSSATGIGASQEASPATGKVPAAPEILSTEKPGDAAPSAYAIPPQRSDDSLLIDEDLEQASPPLLLGSAGVQSGAMTRTLIPPERRREAARKLVGVIRVVRSYADGASGALRRFLPHLLPTSEPNAWAMASPAMIFVAVLVPVVVVTIASAVYFRYGRSVQFEQYMIQVQDARAQALALTDPIAQREAWQRELFYLDKAENYTETSETRDLRLEAQQKLDEVLGIRRLQFQPALSRSLGAQIGRLAANENDVYLLDAQRGNVIHLALTGAGFQIDTSFNCGPGAYGPYTIGPLVDILALPTLNALNAAMLGVDSAGNLLYCSPGQVGQAVPLAVPDTNWGRVRAFTLDSGNLYVLDAQARAVWVYVGDDSAFVDRPYFFFGGQIPHLEDAIDLEVNGDDLYVLHGDSRISTCSYSRIESVPTRCIDPAALSNPFKAYGDQDLFALAHFTQMIFSPPPDSALLLLDSDGQIVFRFSAPALELQAQLRPLAGRSNEMPAAEVTAMGISPNHVLYFALRDRLYFAVDSP